MGNSKYTNCGICNFYWLEQYSLSELYPQFDPIITLWNMHTHNGSTQENYIVCISPMRLVWEANLICISTVKKSFRLNQAGFRPHGHQTRLVQTSVKCILHGQYVTVKNFKYEETYWTHVCRGLQFQLAFSFPPSLFPLQKIWKATQNNCVHS